MTAAQRRALKEAAKQTKPGCPSQAYAQHDQDKILAGVTQQELWDFLQSNSKSPLFESTRAVLSRLPLLLRRRRLLLLRRIVLLLVLLLPLQLLMPLQLLELSRTS